MKLDRDTGRSYRNRLIFLFSAFLIFSMALIGRAVSIQIIGDSRLATLAERQFQSQVLVRPRRGMVLDRHGEPLAINVDAQSLAVNPRRIPQEERVALARKLNRALGISFQQIRGRLESDRAFAWIARHLTDAQLAELKKQGLMKDNYQLVDGFWLVQETKRVYPHGTVASQVLGAVDIDSEGIEGVELWANDRLRGQVTSLFAVRDALGRPSFIDASAARDLRNGENVELTLDAPLQFEVEKALKAAMKKTHAESASVVVMDAVSGEILALANQPTSDPNVRGGPLSHRRNRVVTDGYEPGSTMKTFLYASALAEGWDPQEQMWGGKGQVRIQGKTITEAMAKDKFEWMTLEEMMQRSSNVVSAKLAIRLGAPTFLQTLRDLGFGQRSGLGFPGEISGWIPSTEAAIQPLSLATMGFGQGLTTTRIQMAAAYATILNGGWKVRPTLIQKREGLFGSRPKRIFEREVTENVQAALLKAVEDGTGQNARLSGYRIAGKTGTAQVVDPETRRYSRDHYIGSFIGFALNVEPRLVILATVDRPKGVFYGSQTAAPLFRDVMKAAAQRYSMPMLPHEEENLGGQPEGEKSLSTFAAYRKPLEILGVAERKEGDGPWHLPDLRGFSAREALRALEGYPWEVRLDGFGIVDQQIPMPGVGLRAGEKVSLTLKRPH
jgi:cell division protein FtsI (penicillin-binding protein 3)